MIALTSQLLFVLHLSSAAYIQPRTSTPTPTDSTLPYYTVSSLGDFLSDLDSDVPIKQLFITSLPYNTTGWKLPKSLLGCQRMILLDKYPYPTFIDEEYRCGSSYTCSEVNMESLHECMFFLDDPSDYLGKYFDKTPHVPKYEYECTSV